MGRMGLKMVQESSDTKESIWVCTCEMITGWNCNELHGR